MIQLSVLGSVDLRREDGTRVESVLAQPKRVALLTYLALTAPRGSVARDTLLVIFWPEFEDHRARNNLSRALHHLRQHLGSDALVSLNHHEVGLNLDRVRCDAVEFTAALERDDPEGALELYRGRVLEGFRLEGAPEFDQWLSGVQDRFARAAAEAARGLARKAEHAGRFRDATRWCRRALEITPYDERVARQLVNSLLAQGDRAEALVAFEDFVRRLEADLGLEPDAETMALGQVAHSAGVVSSSTSSARVFPARDHERAEDISAGGDEDSPRPAPVEPPAHRERSEPSPSPHVTEARPVLVGSMAAVGVLVLAGAWAVGRAANDTEVETPLVENRVVVLPLRNGTDDAGLDPLGEMAAEWIEQGLLASGLVEVAPGLEVRMDAEDLLNRGEFERGPDLEDELARLAGARIQVRGSYHLQADSLYLVGEVFDTEQGIAVLAVGPVSTPVDRPVDGVETFRQRVVGALATVVDARLASWSALVRSPPTLESYEAYARGMDLFFDAEVASHVPGPAPWGAAAEQLLAAGGSGFVMPHIWAVYALNNGFLSERADSVLRTLEGRRASLTRWEGLLVDLQRALLDGDPEVRYDRARRIYAMAPGSEWAFKLAVAASRLNRHDEAIDVLRQVDPRRGWLSRWPAYYALLAGSLWEAGRYPEERDAILEASNHMPGNPRIKVRLARNHAVQGEVGSAHGLSRELRSSGLAPADVLTWHVEIARAFELGGLDEEAHRLAQEALRWAQSGPDADRESPEFGCAVGQLIAGWRDEAELSGHVRTLDRWQSADVASIAGPLHSRDLLEARFCLGWLHGRAGDAAVADSAADTITAERPRYDRGRTSWWLAGIAASRGDVAQAVDFLGRASREDNWLGGATWWYPAFDPIRDDPRFQEMVRPR
jgi:DNA-binding SARP family transcriptional activator